MKLKHNQLLYKNTKLDMIMISGNLMVKNLNTGVICAIRISVDKSNN